MPSYTPSDLYENDKWEFKLPEDTVDINDGHLSRDIELFFSQEDVVNLFDWRKKNFVRICEFTSGSWLKDGDEEKDN